MLKKPTELLEFKSFCQGNIVVKNQAEIEAYEKKIMRMKFAYKTVLRVGVATLVICTALPIPTHAAAAISETAVAVVAAAANGKGSWDNLIDKIMGLLDPAAKIFGLIAGIAIMTGNGKIGLERLFWLSLGYLTARKVEDWINFLNTV